MVKIGFHVSIAGGISNSIDSTLQLGCNTFQIFSRSPRRWDTKALEEKDIKDFKKKKEEKGFDSDSIFIHMPYLPNLASSNEELHKRSISVLMDEIIRSSLLDISYVIIHLGSHGGDGNDRGIKQLISACKYALENYDKPNFNNNHETKKIKTCSSRIKKSISILLENNTGKKNSIGSKFDELAVIFDSLKSSIDLRSHSVGICLDTCHAFAAGYDLRTKDKVDETFDVFNDQIGLKNIKALHLNDSKGDLNSNRDLHEHIGLGKIGLDGFKSILNKKIVNEIPMIMETPVDNRRDDHGNLKVIQSIIGNNN